MFYMEIPQVNCLIQYPPRSFFPSVFGWFALTAKIVRRSSTNPGTGTISAKTLTAIKIAEFQSELPELSYVFTMLT